MLWGLPESGGAKALHPDFSPSEHAEAASQLAAHRSATQEPNQARDDQIKEHVGLAGGHKAVAKHMSELAARASEVATKTGRPEHHAKAEEAHTRATHAHQMAYTGEQTDRVHTAAVQRHAAAAGHHAGQANVARGAINKSEANMSNGLSGWLAKATGGIPGATTESFDSTGANPNRENTRVSAGGGGKGIPGTEGGDACCTPDGDSPPETLHEGTPDIEPGEQANGHWLGEDGVKAGPAKSGEQLANTRSGKGGEVGIPGVSGESVKTTKLSADDDRSGVEPKVEDVPQSDKAGAGRDLNKAAPITEQNRGGVNDVGTEVFQSRVAFLRKAAAEGARMGNQHVPATRYQPEPRAADRPQPMVKAINGVIYSNADDLALEELEKSRDPFYAGGGAATLVPSVGILAKAACGGCGAPVPSYLTTCPNCGNGARGGGTLVKAATPVHARLAPPREQVLRLPNGTLTDK